MTYAHDTPDMQEDAKDGALLSNTAITLLAAGAIGFAVGAVIWQQRRSHPQRFASFDRAVDMARSGAVDTMNKLNSRLRDEGYSPAQIEGRAKRYLSDLIDSVQRRL
jgi:hypothetical protein